MKPTWEGAPEWANYLAMDENGDWFWYQNKPEPLADSWTMSGKKNELMKLAQDTILPPWDETLEKRPK